MKKLLALFCRICPFCVLARRYPDSSLAAKLREAEKNCPACKAYAQVYGRPAHSSPRSKD
ncbi:MAG TPA: hypothetical protein PL033_00080 [Candidatus Brocadiia bacterium]|nr:hypothetical protein [Candidatus Brocadiia bacterium]